MTGGSPTRAWLRREKRRELADLFAVLDDIGSSWKLRAEAQARLRGRHGSPPLPPWSWATQDTGRYQLPWVTWLG